MYNAPHIPVMLKEVLEFLNPQDDKVYIDGTFGAGGYTKAILEKADCKVFAIDQDENVKKYADEVKAKYGDRFAFLQGDFASMQELVANQNVDKVDGIVLDIGVSSMQIDEAVRGFSFQKDGPLDMRMGGQSYSAKDFINEASEKDIADIIYQYGDERKSRAIAKAIVKKRADEVIDTTSKLADIVRGVFPKKRYDIDPATRTFQAIRIYINDELEQLKKALIAAESLLKAGGRLVVVTFHSLEDVIVKKFFKEKSGDVPNYSRHMPIEIAKEEKVFELMSRKAVKPSQQEIDRNVRARSAKLRAVKKT